MTAKILSGKQIADAIKSEVAAEVREIENNHGFKPLLAVVRVGDDAASAVYVGSKVRTSEEIGMISEHHHLAADAAHEEVLRLVEELNNRAEVDGILVQLPLPPQIKEREILEKIDSEKTLTVFIRRTSGDSGRDRKRSRRARRLASSKSSSVPV